MHFVSRFFDDLNPPYCIRLIFSVSCIISKFEILAMVTYFSVSLTLLEYQCWLLSPPLLARGKSRCFFIQKSMFTCLATVTNVRICYQWWEKIVCRERAYWNKKLEYKTFADMLQGRTGAFRQLPTLMVSLIRLFLIILRTVPSTILLLIVGGLRKHKVDGVDLLKGLLSLHFYRTVFDALCLL